jgi:hypothetical protein
MRKFTSDVELTFEKNTEALWEDFEKTGSVETYLQFIQKAEKNVELKPADLSF